MLSNIIIKGNPLKYKTGRGDKITETRLEKINCCPGIVVPAFIGLGQYQEFHLFTRTCFMSLMFREKYTHLPYIALHGNSQKFNFFFSAKLFVTDE